MPQPRWVDGGDVHVRDGWIVRTYASQSGRGIAGRIVRRNALAAIGLVDTKPKVP